MLPKKCSFPECGRKVNARSLCSGHYKQNAKGQPLRMLGGSSLSAGMTDAERFWIKVDKSGECWQWTGYLGKLGYGQFKTEDTMKKAHRVSWEMANGPILHGRFIDHICHNRGCVNPDHLRLVTPKGNIENHDGQAKSNNKLGVRGVSWHKSKRCYVAQVRHNKKTYGRDFTNLAEASAYVVRLRNSLHKFNDRDRTSK